MNKIETARMLAGRCLPTTTEVGFLEIDAVTAASFFAKWQGSLQAKRSGSASLMERNGLSGLSAALESLLPLTSVERRRMIFVPTASKWTAYFDNGSQGTDAFSVISYLSEQLSCRGIKFRYQPHTAQKSGREWIGQFGSTIFEMYGPEATDWLNTVRSIYVSFDRGKWQFGTTGTQQWFENAGYYGNIDIRERFNADILEEYLKILEINCFDANFYNPDGKFFLIEKLGPCNPNVEEFDFFVAD